MTVRGSVTLPAKDEQEDLCTQWTSPYTEEQAFLPQASDSDNQVSKEEYCTSHTGSMTAPVQYNDGASRGTDKNSP